jgi:hypothetical protein
MYGRFSDERRCGDTEEDALRVVMGGRSRDISALTLLHSQEWLCYRGGAVRCSAVRKSSGIKPLLHEEVLRGENPVGGFAG